MSFIQLHLMFWLAPQFHKNLFFDEKLIFENYFLLNQISLEENQHFGKSLNNPFLEIRRPIDALTAFNFWKQLSILDRHTVDLQYSKLQTNFFFRTKTKNQLTIGNSWFLFKEKMNEIKIWRNWRRNWWNQVVKIEKNLLLK